MSSKYHVDVKETPPRFAPVPKLCALEIEGCLGCRECVKRTACVYDVYGRRRFDPAQVVDTGDVLCINCLRCVQECKKRILARAPNPRFARLGDDYWRPELIASIWRQAETGKIPVSGAGYRGPFAGPGFDRMWTDMSEIVRPTRDGIHGREYISTVIELGRRPARLEFDDRGDLARDLPRFAEIPVPLLLEIPDRPFVGEAVKAAVAGAAVSLETFALAGLADAAGPLSGEREHLAARFDPARDDPERLAGLPLAVLPWAEDAAAAAGKLKEKYPELIACVRVPLDERAVERALALAAAGAEVLILEADQRGRGFGQRAKDFMIELIKEVHFALLDEALRDQLTLIGAGGMAMAEHLAKAIACGVDGVILDLALLAALECRLCSDCARRRRCPAGLDELPVESGRQRIVNLVGAWHSQLVEVMGAMGLREVRRLRGELGRTMFFLDLEKESFAPLFGTRRLTLDEALAAPPARQDEVPGPAAPPDGRVKPAPTRFRNSLARWRVERTSACVKCGACAAACPFGVHVEAGGRMLAPRSHLCRGPDYCRAREHLCLDACPTGALRIGPDPQWAAFGDPRWPAELLASTWDQAESGRPPDHRPGRAGASGGGFDRLELAFPPAPAAGFSPAEVNLAVPLNRTGDGRPAVTIGLPFYGGGMSFGSISLDTMLARAAAYREFDSFTCTGEGGYPEELKPYDDHVITQVATGLFGVREETIQRVRMVEFKYAQGAKPGLGGHLLGDKNTPAVAKMREAVQGFPLFSPFPFHSVYSVEDHKKHVDWIKEINPRALVSVKVSGASDVDMVAVGSYYAGAHVVHLDGSYGGTGAAPDIAKKNIAMPIEYAVPRVHRFLVEEGVRDRITLAASGGIRSAWDLAKIVALGADVVVIGTAEMVALECVRCGACESGRGCPRGIATTDPELSVMFSHAWARQRLVNLFASWALQLKDILWRLGLKDIRELVGRSDLLRHLDYREAKG